MRGEQEWHVVGCDNGESAKSIVSGLDGGWVESSDVKFPVSMARRFTMRTERMENTSMCQTKRHISEERLSVLHDLPLLCAVGSCQNGME